MWYLLQYLVIFAFVMSNVHYHWAHQSTANVLGFLAALLVTVGLGSLIDSVRR